jgi:hypothetical protein
LSDAPFSRRATRWLVGVIGGSLLLALAWGIFGPDIGWEKSARPNSFSYSAIGHRAFVALLDELGVPVTVSRFDSGARAGKHALLVIIEPGALEHERDTRDLRAMLRAADRTLLVLPKWAPVERFDHPPPERDDWVSEVELLDPEEVGEVLALLGIGGRILRPTGPVEWSYGELGARPNLARPQVIERGGVSPIVSCEQGILLGKLRVPWGDVTVLSDPDVLSNHGLARGGNAAFTVRALDLARGDREPVVLDETTHGFARNPNLYRSLFEFPLLLATVQALVVIGVLLWAAMGRFGAPERAGPAIEPGKDFLIDNIATMLRFGGHTSLALTGYLRVAVADVREKLHVPARLDDAEARAWLDRNAAGRRVHLTLDRLAGMVGKTAGRRDRVRTLRIAQLIHRWREEMIHGRGNRT